MREERVLAGKRNGKMDVVFYKKHRMQKLLYEVVKEV